MTDAKPDKPKASKKEGKAFSIERQDGNWVMVTIHYRGREILSIERTMPDLMAVAIERFKINAAKYWGTL